MVNPATYGRPAAAPLDEPLAFVFTDIEGSTKLLERLEGAYGDVLATHGELVRAAIMARGGREIDTQGDAFFIVFPEARDAVRFAAGVQATFAAHPWPEGTSVRLRIGVHAGRAMHTRTGYVGMDVHHGARVAAAAHGGQVLVSGAVAAALGDVTGASTDETTPPLRSLGTFHLKDIREPVELFQVEVPGLPGEFPPPRTLDEVDEPPAAGDPPYPGLARYEEADAERFFGREAPVRSLVERLERDPFLAVVGASGSGKSSLVRAGLVPALRRSAPDTAAAVALPRAGPRAIALLTPTEQPLVALDAALAAVTGQPWAIVVDQLEELFTLCRDDAVRTGFVERILGLLDTGTRVIVVLRADFYDRLAVFDRLRTLAADDQAYLGPLGHDDLRAAIEGPAHQGGWRIAPGLVDLIIHDVGHEPGALPLLSHALRETWEGRRGTQLTLRGYLDSGGVQGAIARTADQVVGDLDGPDLDTARSIFLRLTELGRETPDTRRRASLDELLGDDLDAGRARPVLDRLVAARLVVTDDRTAEVAHEALIREWPQLREWLDADREALRLHRMLTDAATDWDRAGRDASLLFRGGRLAQATEWLAGHGRDANALEHGFITASREATEQEAAEREAARQRELDAAHRAADAERARADDQARSAKRLKRGAAALVGLLVVAVALGGFAVVQVQRADEATVEAVSQADLALQREAEAESQQRISLSRQLAAQSVASSREDLDLALLLSLESGRAADTTEARSSLLTALSRDPTLVTLLPTDIPVHGLAFSPDGRTLRAGSIDHEAIVRWDLEDGQRTEGERVSGLWENQLVEFAFTADGRLAAAPMGGPFALNYPEPLLVRIWDVATGEQLLDLPETRDDVRRLVFSPDGRTLAVADGRTDPTVSGARVVLWDVETGALVSELELEGELAETQLYQVVFSPDGTQLAVSGGNGSVALWDLATTTARVLYGAREPQANGESHYVALGFSPDGATLATGAEDGTITLWETATGSRVGEPFGGGAPIGLLAFGRDGAILGSATGRTIDLWDIGTRTRIGEPLAQHTDFISTLAFSPDGRTLAAADDDVVALWAVERRHPLAEVVHRTGQPTTSGAIDPAGDVLAVGMADGTIILWDLVLDASIGESMMAHPLTDQQGIEDGRPWMRGVNALTFSPDGSILASGGADGTVRRWDATSGEPLGVPSLAHSGTVPALAFSPDGSLLVSGGEDANARVWDPATGAQLGEPLRADTPEAEPYRLHRRMIYEAVYDIAFSPDGRTFATAGGLSSVLWDVATRTQLGKPLGGHAAFAMGIAISPDGRLLAAPDVDGAIFIWDIERRERIGLLENSGEVSDVDFSLDGETLVARIEDSELGLPARLVLWDVAGAQRVGEQLAVDEQVASEFFAPDGSLITVGGADGTVLRWDMEEASWRTHACAIAGRNLTPEEWATYLGNEPYRETCPADATSGS